MHHIIYKDKIEVFRTRLKSTGKWHALHLACFTLNELKPTHTCSVGTEELSIDEKIADIEAQIAITEKKIAAEKARYE